MSKFVAIFRGNPEFVVGELLRLGLSVRNPGAGNINAFNCAGDEVIIQDGPAALNFLLKGNGISLWLAPDHDFFVSLHEKQLYGYFDGFTDDEQAAFILRMRSAGLSLEVKHEDDAYA
jgi:hypothetical protein